MAGAVWGTEKEIVREGVVIAVERKTVEVETGEGVSERWKWRKSKNKIPTSRI